MYSNRPVALGVLKTWLDNTRLKDKLLAAIPEQEENKGSKLIFLSFKIW